LHRITTTMRPDEEIEVQDDEFLDLSRQGLIHHEVGAESAEKATEKKGTKTDA
jgi:hypothetical protein